MTAGRTNTMKVGTKIGAGIGVLAFLVFGIIPGFYFGSYGTLVLLSHLAGGPVGPTTIVRMLTVVGHYAWHLLRGSSEHSAWLSIWNSNGICS